METVRSMTDTETNFRRAQSFRHNRRAETNITLRKTGFLTPPSNRYNSYGDYSPFITSKQYMDRSPHMCHERKRLMSESPIICSSKPLSRSPTKDAYETLLKHEVFKEEVQCQKEIIQDLLVSRKSSVPFDASIIAPEDEVFGASFKKCATPDTAFERKTYDRTISWPSHTISTPKDTNISSRHRCSSDSEVLEPFQVVSEFKRKPPSYWLGCLYRFVPGTNKLEITLRQTGVLPDILAKNKFSKLSVCVQLPDTNSQHFVLVKSKSDVSFRPHLMFFNVKDKESVQQQELVVRLYHHTKLFLKKCIAEWKISLERCTEETRTEWRKYPATEN